MQAVFKFVLMLHQTSLMTCTTKIWRTTTAYWPLIKLYLVVVQQYGLWGIMKWMMQLGLTSLQQLWWKWVLLMFSQEGRVRFGRIVGLSTKAGPENYEVWGGAKKWRFLFFKKKIIERLFYIRFLLQNY